jgi:hypothetical protein
VSAEWRSNLGAFEGATERAIKAGLIAAAELYAGDMRERLHEGFTSGDFVTGNLANSVQRGDPTQKGDGWEIPVGSTQTNPPYALYWELGHINLFVKTGGGSVMGGYVRIPTWEPMMVKNRLKYVAAVTDEIRVVDGAL